MRLTATFSNLTRLMSVALLTLAILPASQAATIKLVQKGVTTNAQCAPSLIEICGGRSSLTMVPTPTLSETVAPSGSQSCTSKVSFNSPARSSHSVNWYKG